MDVLEAIASRRSVRRYQKGAHIPRENIEKLLDAAMHAPSAVNSRPWEFYCSDKEEVKTALMAAHPASRMLETASWVIAVCARPDLQPATTIGSRTVPRRQKTSCSRQRAWVWAPVGAAVTPPNRARTRLKKCSAAIPFPLP